MKTFNDLKEGDYIYELDTFSGNLEYLKISKIISLSFNDKVIISFDREMSIYFHKNKSSKNLFEVIYFCNREDCLDKLSKLIKHNQAVLKNAKQNIQKLKEL